MKKLFILLSLFFLTSCTSVAFQVKEPLLLPEVPKALVIDNGKIDKAKYPNTIWVSMPKLDVNKKTATWSLEDVNKISKSIADQQVWSTQVKDKVDLFNKELAEQQEQLKKEINKSWYKGK